MATSEQIRYRIVDLANNKEFNKDDLLHIFAYLTHEGIIDNDDIIETVKYLLNDILQAKTRTEFAKQINPRTGRKRSYNAHKFAKKKFLLSNVEFIVDND